MLDMMMSAAIKASHQAIPLKGGGGKDNVSKTKPMWKEDVKPQRSDVIFWHSVWNSAGRPEAAEDGDRALMVELKKTLSKQKSGQSVPESLEG